MLFAVLFSMATGPAISQVRKVGEDKWSVVLVLAADVASRIWDIRGVDGEHPRHRCHRSKPGKKPVLCVIEKVWCMLSQGAVDEIVCRHFSKVIHAAGI